MPEPTHVVIDLGDGRAYVQRTGPQTNSEMALQAEEEAILHLHGQLSQARTALDAVALGDFRREWLAEADRLWQQRCDAMREIDPPDPRPEVPALGEHDAWVWLTRCREMLRAAVLATNWAPGAPT